jgi:hypothetical protein
MIVVDHLRRTKQWQRSCKDYIARNHFASISMQKTVREREHWDNLKTT